MNPRPHLVVAAVDHRPDDDPVLALAVEFARRYHVEVRLLHVAALRPPLTGEGALWFDEQALWSEENRRVERIAGSIRDTQDVAVDAVVRGGPAVGALLAESGPDTLLVLGPGAAGRPGSVVGRVLDRARGPVLVATRHEVEGPAAADSGVVGPVVVGLDGSAASPAVLAVAAAEADARGRDLYAVHVWWGPSNTGLGAGAAWGEGPERAEQEAGEAAGRDLSEILADRAGSWPDLKIHPHAVRGRAQARELIAFAADVGAGLVVVGSRSGLPGVAGLRLGSVSRKVVAGAACPVLVVPTGPAATA